MIKISNGDSEFIVTKGVYENKFKSLGYEIVSEKKQSKPVQEAKVVEEKPSQPEAPKTENSKVSNRK